MKYMDWDNSYSVKIESIDEQHKKLIELINDFYEGILKKSPREKMKDIVKGLKDYSAFHFSNEEKLMQQFAYSNYAEHKRVHDSFIAKVDEFSTRLKNDDFILSIEITNFIKDWLIRHIKGVDRQYSDFFIKNGVK